MLTVAFYRDLSTFYQSVPHVLLGSSFTLRLGFTGSLLLIVDPGSNMFLTLNDSNDLYLYSSLHLFSSKKKCHQSNINIKTCTLLWLYSRTGQVRTQTTTLCHKDKAGTFHYSKISYMIPITIKVAVYICVRPDSFESVCIWVQVDLWPKFEETALRQGLQTLATALLVFQPSLHL